MSQIQIPSGAKDTGTCDSKEGNIHHKAGDTNPPRLRSVLIARFSALGDVAMTVPVLYSACAIYPDVTFTIVTRSVMTSIFINHPANLNVVGVNLDNYSGATGIYRLFRELRDTYRFDAFIDLHDVLRTKLLRMFCHIHGLPVATINKGRKGKQALTRRHNKVLLPLTSTRARYRQTFHRIGLPVDNRFEGLYGHSPHVDPEIFSQITPPKENGEAWVGIAPFAKHAGKIYPPALMEQVVRHLSSLGYVRIFLFGAGDNEEETLSMWAQQYPDTISLAGKRYGFPVELALVSNLNVMVTMDSANMHLASLVNTPVISIWGATHPYCGFKGWRQKEDDIIQLPMTCRPCSVFGNKPCFRDDYHCLRGISPQVILDHVMKYIDDGAANYEK